MTYTFQKCGVVGVVTLTNQEIPVGSRCSRGVVRCSQLHLFDIFPIGVFHISWLFLYGKRDHKSTNNEDLDTEK